MGSHTELATTEIKPSSQDVGPQASFEVTFKVLSGYQTNGYSADIYVGPIVTDFDATVDVIDGVLPLVSSKEANSSWKICGATNADDGPYGKPAAKVPYGDIKGINPETGLAKITINNLTMRTVTYAPGAAGANAEGMPSPLSDSVSDTGYTLASAPTWTTGNTENKTFAGWKLTSGTVDDWTDSSNKQAGAVIGTITDNITLEAQWAAPATWQLTLKTVPAQRMSPARASAE
ncbi:MAG: hypothetical protein LBT88_08695 [Oscillospiraceae bacterium]|nr:hypothetical protein [Oscillospiraceae bacterium]